MKRTTKQGSAARMMTLLAAALLAACGTETSASESELARGLTQGWSVVPTKREHAATTHRVCYFSKDMSLLRAQHCSCPSR